MSVNVVRFQIANDSQVKWGTLKESRILALPESYETLAEFLEKGRKGLEQRAAESGLSYSPEEVHFLSPVTDPCQILCQGQNYSEHIKESGTRPEDKNYNLIFQKAASSLTGAHDSVMAPAHVRLLDYELELGLVISRKITEEVQVTDENLHEYVAGLVMGNDVSARDVQIPEEQWYKGKSYRTFCPVGPCLTLLSPEEFRRIPELHMKLDVNGETRQEGRAGEMLFTPAETLTELSQITNLYPGDLVLTGTPAGVALKAPGQAMQRIASLLFSPPKRMKIFVNKQAKLKNYLKQGDVITATIATPDQKINLGRMENTVTSIPKTY